MTLLPKAVRTFVRASLRFAFRLIRFLFILGLVMLPSPLTAWIVVILEPLRRNLPAEVLRKEDEPAPP
ncbi:hypothetical protein ATI61_10321 [Archangium gephyra]|uniref:Uncharacterized protein n=1 Tax=Archangium gephyra TaxID=48 RepID=A0AAC8Q5F3_9BACT|nr:hypothetical protein [Archangium gephyra]AKJ01316.1 Hypothetical protein AA314_02942 [Archangium gephyra]REG34140.1 hypothetical protein ATI61_10321 [Archangium gephyra]